MMLEEDREVMETIWKNMLINLAWFTAYVLIGMALYNIILILLLLDKWRQIRRTGTVGTRRTPSREELVDPKDLRSQRDQAKENVFKSY